jgi:hypothetical protein
MPNPALHLSRFSLSAARYHKLREFQRISYL